MAKKKYKNTAGENFVPARPFFANCMKISCGRGYTAKNLETAGHHCICGAKMTWNEPDNKTRPTFLSSDK